MAPFVGPFWAACALLVVSGAIKLFDGRPLERGLHSVGIPAPRGVGRAIGLTETGVGVLGVLVPGEFTALLVAVCYGAFAAFISLALARGGALASCGCFGRADSVPTVPHFLVTLAFAAVAAIHALQPHGRFHEVGMTATTAGLAALIAFLGWQAMAVLPTVSPASIRSGTRTGE